MLWMKPRNYDSRWITCLTEIIENNKNETNIRLRGKIIMDDDNPLGHEPGSSSATGTSANRWYYRTSGFFDFKC